MGESWPPAGLPSPYYVDASCVLYCGTAEQILPCLRAESVELICVDPPYFRMKTDEWDRQWPNERAYLGWLRGLCHEWRRVLVANGSVYCFASPLMAWAVEGVLRESFHMLTQIVWDKPTGNANCRAEKEALRAYAPNTERILFAEQYASDAIAAGESGFQQAERTLRTSLFAAPIAAAMQGTQTTAKEVTEAIGAYGTVNHGGAVSNWLQGYNIPSKVQYEAMRQFFNSRNGAEYLRQDYEALRQDYEALRQDYEALRQDYEALRRPFFLTSSERWSDIWRFPTVQPGPAKHPCEKPLSLLSQMVLVSSCPGDVVLDCCAGSGSTLEAAKRLGRRAIGIEREQKYCAMAARRLAQEVFAF